MFLITQLWNFNDSRRRQEILDCLIENTKNRMIKKIYILHEPNSEINLKHNKIVNLQSSHKLTYLELFKKAAEISKTTPFIVTNADIQFDASLIKLNGYKFDNVVIALSSYKNGEIEDFSFDSFIFKPEIIDKISFSSYLIGQSHNDLRFVKSLLKSKIEVRNPSLDIESQHKDYRSLLKIDRTEVFDYIEPSKVHKKIVTVINNFAHIKKKAEEIERKKKNRSDLINRLNDVRLQEIKADDFGQKNSLRETKEILRKELGDIEIGIGSVSYDNYVRDYIDDKRNMVVIIHLYYQDMWSEIKTYLDNITMGFDLYVTMTEGSASLGQFEWMRQTIKNNFPNANVFILPNKGLDIGPFMYCLDQIYESNSHYTYLLKIHTKKSVKTSGLKNGRIWRNDLIEPLIGTENKFKKNIKIFETNPDVGMIGANKWITKHLLNNKTTIDYYKDKLGVDHASDFIGGTIFLVRFEIIKKYMVNVMSIYDELETGYFTDHGSPTKTHALERILGYIVKDNKQKILGV